MAVMTYAWFYGLLPEDIPALEINYNVNLSNTRLRTGVLIAKSNQGWVKLYGTNALKSLGKITLSSLTFQ